MTNVLQINRKFSGSEEPMHEKMLCHITDGPSDPEDADDRWRAFDPDFAEYQEPDPYEPEEDYDMTPEQLETRLDAIVARLDDHQDVLDRIQIIARSSVEPDRTELYKALAAAQGELHNAEANTENEFIGKRYANLAAVLDALRGPLSSNGLALIQLPEPSSQPATLGLRTILAHESGQCIENYYEMSPPKLDPQGIGSCMTYMRRYAAMAICGIAGALDDDAERTKAEAPKITPAEADAILNLADELFGADADALLDRMCAKIFDCDSVPQIPQGQAEVAMQRIRNTKARKDREAADRQKESAERQAAGG
jgi:hypothetical protein